MGVFYGISATACFREHLFPFWLKWNASLAAAALRNLGENALAAGPDIISTETQVALAIRRGCDAVEPIAFFITAVAAFPAAWRLKLVGMAIGAAGLIALNFIRIISLFLIRVHYPGAFEIAHVEVWQMAFVLAAMAIWLAWARHAMRDHGAPHHAA